MTQPRQIGFSQRIRLEWLEYTAGLVLAGCTREEVDAALQDLLRDLLSVGGTAERGNREKAITILLRTWVSVPDRLRPLRDEGLHHLRRLPAGEHLPVHWGMTMAAYPFFASVAEVVGRLLRLQGTASAAQIQRRIRERLGERATVARAARRVLRCFVDWGRLCETEHAGTYRSAAVRPVADTHLVGWLIEATLISSGFPRAALDAIIESPSLFPFSLGQIRGGYFESNRRLEFFRGGVDEQMVAVRGRA
jgi:hypothetical protein